MLADALRPRELCICRAMGLSLRLSAWQTEGSACCQLSSASLGSQGI